LPHLATALCNKRSIAESQAGLPFGVLGAEAFPDQLLRAFFHMQAYFFGQVVVELVTTEDIRYPMHRKYLLIRW
jgi:hypothetical protein